MGRGHLQNKSGNIPEQKQEAGTNIVKAPSRNVIQLPGKSTADGQARKFNNTGLGSFEKAADFEPLSPPSEEQMQSKD
ncbi:uncharacterized protein N7483_002850 [Penicillium malachiteum]|uniref:uncharacterized protein n=1 Tax=Penicillium malachiteum TaxID=1324776 RepID=UPI002546EF4E|nr:uncharacterized protein N7483_002850 [Penicillium malachiteum]KAJ5737725.1 hypothetical protein N7483_002850 [Penicillium malachiteum]